MNERTAQKERRKVRSGERELLREKPEQAIAENGYKWFFKTIPQGADVYAGNQQVKTNIIHRNSDKTLLLKLDEQQKARLASNNIRSLKRQFEILSSLHALAPENTAKPILLVKVFVGAESNLVGYLSEYIHGPTFEEKYGIESRSPNDRLEYGLKARLGPSERQAFFDNIATLDSVVKAFHNAGIGHGDLGPTNIIIQDGGTLKLIDPFVDDSPDNIKADLEDMERYHKLLRAA